MTSGGRRAGAGRPRTLGSRGRPAGLTITITTAQRRRLERMRGDHHFPSLAAAVRFLIDRAT